MNKSELLEQLKDVTIPYRDSLNMKDNATFGVEIEAINAYIPDFSTRYDFIRFIDDYLREKDIKEIDYENAPWIIKPERTFLNEGLRGSEMVSPILHNTKKDYEDLKRICLLLKDKGARTGYCTGGHIHFGVNSFDNINVSSILNLLELWAVFEDVIYLFSTGDYTNLRPMVYQNAVPIRNDVMRVADGLLDFKGLFTDDMDELLDAFGTVDRGLRLENLKSNRTFNQNKDTIEVRCPNGTLEHTIWQNNISFFYHLLDYALSDRFDAELIEDMLKRVKPNKGTIKKQIENYMKLDVDKAILLGNLIFTDEKDKLYYLRSLLKVKSEEEDYYMQKVKKFYKQ